MLPFGFHFHFFKEENWRLKTALQMILHFLVVTSFLQVLSHLFIFGCIITHIKLETLQLHKMIENKKLIALINVVQDLVETYFYVKNTFSQSLFFIFTTETINITLMIYVNIRTSIYLTPLSIGFNFYTLSILVVMIYLCLGSEDANQSRLSLIQDLWYALLFSFNFS